VPGARGEVEGLAPGQRVRPKVISTHMHMSTGDQCKWDMLESSKGKKGGRSTLRQGNDPCKEKWKRSAFLLLERTNSVGGSNFGGPEERQRRKKPLIAWELKREPFEGERRGAKIWPPNVGLT